MPAPVLSRLASLWTQGTDKTRRAAATAWRLSVELYREHEFWIQTLAIKGGFSAMALAGVGIVSSAVSLPFLAAAGVIAAAGGLCAVGVYGVVKGSQNAWRQLREIYGRVTGRPMPPKPRKAFAASRLSAWRRLQQHPKVKSWMAQRWLRKLHASRAWRITRQEAVLNGLAVGGAVLSLGVGATMLATQVIVLPVVALSGLLTVTTVMAASYIGSGVSGLYFAARGLKAQRKRRKSSGSLRVAGLSAPPLPVPKISATFKKARQSPDNEYSKSSGLKQNHMKTPKSS